MSKTTITSYARSTTDDSTRSQTSTRYMKEIDREIFEKALVQERRPRENPYFKTQGLSSGLTTVMPSSFSISSRREIISPSSVVNVSKSGTVSLIVFV